MTLILYGAGSGVFSIAKSTLPLAEFGSERYAPLVGKLARPSLIAQALAPTAGGAVLLDKAGSSWTYAVIMLLAVIKLVLGAALWKAKGWK